MRDSRDKEGIQSNGTYMNSSIELVITDDKSVIPGDGASDGPSLKKAKVGRPRKAPAASHAPGERDSSNPANGATAADALSAGRAMCSMTPRRVVMTSRRTVSRADERESTDSIEDFTFPRALPVDSIAAPKRKKVMEHYPVVESIVDIPTVSPLDKFNIENYINEVIECRQPNTKTFYHAQIIKLINGEGNRGTVIVKWLLAGTTEELPLDFEYLRLVEKKRKRKVEADN